MKIYTWFYQPHDLYDLRRFTVTVNMVTKNPTEKSADFSEM